MRTVKKFFDESGNEVAAARASRCHETEIDDNDKVVKERHYLTDEVKNGFNPAGLSRLVRTANHDG